MVRVREHGIYERRDGKIDAVVCIEGNVAVLRSGYSVYADRGKSLPCGEMPWDLIREIVVGEGWCPWNGGENPAPGKVVHTILRNGYVSTAGLPSDLIDWRSNGGGSDTLAYRVVEENSEPSAPRSEPFSVNDGCGTKVVSERDQSERINDLLKANVALEERARKAEADRDAAIKESAVYLQRAERAEKRCQKHTTLFVGPKTQKKLFGPDKVNEWNDLQGLLDIFEKVLSDDDGLSSPSGPPTFFMIHGAGMGGATVRHGSRANAVTEAKRLASAHPGKKFAVLRAECEFTVQPSDPVEQVFGPERASTDDEIPF